MPFTLPTLPELIQRSKEDLQGDALEQSDAQVLARVHAAGLYSLYGYIDYVVKQILPDSADEQMLVRQAELRIGGRKRPTYATGKISLTGTQGAFVPEGSELQAKDGRKYVVVEAVTLAEGTTSAIVRSAETGLAQNAAAGTELNFVSPVSSVEGKATVDEPGITGGEDLESVEALRQRLIRSYRVVPHGGCADDYITWALEVPGVSRAWVIPNHMGAGTVGVFCVKDVGAPSSATAPSSEELNAIKAHIDEVRPVTADVYVKAPTLKPITFSIKLTPDTAAVRASVTSALKNLIATEATLGGTLLISHVRQAVSNATGETDNVVMLPTGDVKADATALLTFGSISWV